MNKKTLISLLSVICMAAIVMAGCTFDAPESDESSSGSGGSGSHPQATVQNDFDNPDFQYEQEGAEIKPVEHKEKDFMGTWQTGSDYAEYLYGNVKLVISSDHTWSGNITNEPFSGKWVKNRDGINIKSDEAGIINWNLFFVNDNTLMFTDMDDRETSLVLQKVR